MRRADARQRACSPGTAPPTTSMLRTGARHAAASWRRSLGAALVAAMLAACAPGTDGGQAPEDAIGPEQPVPAPEVDEAPAEEPVDPAPPPPRRVEPDPDPPPPPETREGLQGQIVRVVDAALASFDQAAVGILIVDEHGREVHAVQPDAALLPASTQKLVTAAGILRTMGPEARLRTVVESSAPIRGNGTLRGDLHLLGTGDPVLASDDYGRWVYPARPRTPLEELADQLVDAGLERLRGDVLVDADGFVGPPRAEGWRDSYFSDLDARLVGGLTVDAGLETLVSFPDGPDLELEDHEDTDDRVRVRPRPRPDPEDQEELGPPRVLVQAADDPGVQAGVELIRELQQRGVQVDGGAVAGPIEQPAVGRFAQVVSPPMAELLRFTVRQSDNHLADTLWHVLGRVRTGEGSWEAGARAARQVLDLLGVDHQQATFSDGSGLSRHDRLTPRILVDLDRAMTNGRHAGTWRSLMAVAGEEGTLRTRLRGTPAQGRMLGKTGSLRDVSALSGAVDGEDGRRYHFAVVANDAQGTDRAVVRTLVDEVGLLLTADLLGCRATRDRDAPETALGRPPILVPC